MNEALQLDAERKRPRYEIVVLGDPVPWERAGARVAGKCPRHWIDFYTPTSTRNAERAIADEWRAAGFGRWGSGVALAMFVVFVFARPNTHLGTGRNAGTVKPQFLAKRPGYRGKNAEGRRTGGDTDNLAKLVKDGLSKVAYADDGDVARLEAEKLFTDQAGVAEPQTIIELRTI